MLNRKVESERSRSEKESNELNYGPEDISPTGYEKVVADPYAFKLPR